MFRRWISDDGVSVVIFVIGLLGLWAVYYFTGQWPVH